MKHKLITIVLILVILVGIAFSQEENIELIAEVEHEGLVRQLQYHDGYLYCNVIDPWLRVYDVSNPSNPTIADSLLMPGIHAIWAKDEYGFISIETQLQILDIRDPNNVAVLGEVQVPGITRSLANADGRLIAGSDSDTLSLIDIGDPRNPILIQSIVFDDVWISGVLVSGDKAYVGIQRSGIYEYDFSNPDGLILTGFYPFPHLHSIIINGDIIYVSGYDYEIDLLNISNPENPLIIDSFDNRLWRHFFGLKADTFLVSKKMQIFSFEDPLMPYPTGFYPYINTSTIHENIAFSASGYSILVLDMSQAINETSTMMPFKLEREIGDENEILIQEVFVDGEPMETGTFVAVYDMDSPSGGDLCAGYVEYTGLLPAELTVRTMIPAYEDRYDNARFGEKIFYQVWSESLVKPMMATGLYEHEDHGYFGEVPNLNVTLYAFSPIEVRSNYYDLVSFNRVPENLDAETIFAEIPYMAAVYDDQGDILIPGFNNFGVVVPSEGYRLHVTKDCFWHNPGLPVDEDIVFNVESGRWNWIGYPFSSPEPVESALIEINDILSIILSDGGGIYVPDLGLNTMGMLEPGEGYMVYVNQDADFQYHHAPQRVVQVDEPQLNTAFAGLATPTGHPYAVVIDLDEAIKMMDPVSIHAYDGNLEVGGTVIEDPEEKISIVCWRELSDREGSGYTPGHEISFRIKTRSNETVSCRVDGGVIKFEEKPYATATLHMDDDQIPTEFRVGSAYPNPFNSSTRVDLEVPITSDVTISLYNILGEVVLKKKHHYTPGSHSWTLSHDNLTTFSSGIYFLEVRALGMEHLQKLVYVR